MRVAWKNFTGGEISQTLLARYDLSKYANSLIKMDNFTPNAHGDAVRRSGFKYIATMPSTGGILFPFMFNVQPLHNFIVWMGERTLSVYNGNGLVASGIATPYSIADLYKLSYAQVGDIIYFAHGNYPLHKLLRQDTIPPSPPTYHWSLVQVALNQSLLPPASIVVVWNETSTTPARNFLFQYKIVAVDANGVHSVGSVPGSITGRYPTEWVVGDSINVSWAAVAGAVDYNIYREATGFFGYVGTTTSLTFQDHNYEPNIADTPQINWEPFVNGNNPSVVAFHQQRMVLAGTKYNPNSFYASRTGDFENFRKSRPLQDDDPIEYTLASGSIDSIEWVTSFQDLLIGTSGSEYKAVGLGGTGSAVTAKDISITAQSFWGSSGLIPIIVGNSILHSERYSGKVRDLYYSLERDGYAGNDLSILVPHLFEGYKLKQWTFQQTPASTLWAVRDDGVLLSMTYIKEQDVVGWAVHRTVGNFVSVTRISGETQDIVYALVEREVNGVLINSLEELSPPFMDGDLIQNAFFVDGGVTYTNAAPVESIPIPAHLVGLTVVGLLDGSPAENMDIDGGNYILPYPAKIITVGIPYTSVMAPMPINTDTDTGSTLGLVRAYGKNIVLVHNSVGGSYSPNADLSDSYDFPESPSVWGEAVSAYSGVLSFTLGGGQDEFATIYIMQDKPLPLQILAIVGDVDFGDKG